MTEQQLAPELAEAYAAHGLVVTPPKGNSRWGKTMVCAPHEGVPYCMDSHEGRTPIAHGVQHRALIVARHHVLVKAVYDHCAGLGVGDIWVLSGGGAQLQAFFGNSTGYLAILYLSMADARLDRELADELDACGNTPFTLQVNWRSNDPLFEGRFSHEGIELLTHAAAYGQED